MSIHDKSCTAPENGFLGCPKLVIGIFFIHSHDFPRECHKWSGEAMGNEEKAIGGTIDGNSVSHQTQTNFREFFSSNEIGSPKAEPLGVYTHAEMKTHSPEDQAVHFTI